METMLSNSRKKRYQKAKVAYDSLGADKVTIKMEIDKQYKYVTQIFCFTTPVYGSNVNTTLATPLKINHIDIYPEDFDTGLLFPADSNAVFTKIKEEAAGSMLEVQFNTPSTGSGYINVVLVLENE